jgi:hypothetical protein
MTARRPAIDPAYLRRTKYATPEQKLDWLAAAGDFARIKKTKRILVRDGHDNVAA